MRLVFLMVVSSALLSAAAVAAPAYIEARHFDLSQVRLLDSPFKRASERNAKYLLSIDPDRLLHNTRKYAGLEPKGELYDGWESQGIAGHTLGHYLTALSQQFAATGDQRFRKRIDYIIAEMAECQRRYGDGYVGALPPLELATLRALKDGKVEPADPFHFEGGAWVPWYTQHKVLTGLKDAWVLGGNEQAKEVTLKLADWVDAITAGLSAEQQQKMLQVEQGGMSEVLVDLYSLTGEQRYLDASRRFRHRAILDPLRSGRDELAGKHANTQIPKITGAARNYEVTGEEAGRTVAENFWKTVVRRHSWVIGGNSEGEHFFPTGAGSSHLSAATAETCNTYNMLKLTEHLFSWQPEVEYADYYERALYNHILASQEPEHGMFTYFMSLKPGHFKTYSTPFDSFWCCVGSGMENHTKYGEAIYFHGDDELYVNLFIPSVLTWKDKDFVIEQTTDYPRTNRTQLRVLRTAQSGGQRQSGGQHEVLSSTPVPLTLLVRAPTWAAAPVTFELNGQPVAVDGTPGTYASIERTWKKGDRLVVTIPMGVRTETLRGTDDEVAFLYGPVVLAGDLGRVPRSDTFPYAKEQNANFKAPDVPVPTLSGDPKTIARAVRRVPGKALAFRTEGIGKPDDVTLRPFADLHYDRYNVYWTVVP